MVFVGDSIVRKGDDVVVCIPGAKIEAITERVEKLWLWTREILF